MSAYVIHRVAGHGYATGCMEVAAIGLAGDTLYSKAYPSKHRKQDAENEVLLWCALNHYKVDQSLKPKPERKFK